MKGETRGVVVGAEGGGVGTDEGGCYVEEADVTGEAYGSGRAVD